MSIEKLLLSYDLPVRELAEHTRDFIRKNLPGIKEDVDLPAKLIGYSYGSGYKGTVCTILLSKKGVKIGFYKGSELPDPKQLLTGTGKVHKYVEVNSEDDLKDPALKKLLVVAGENCKTRLQEK